MKKLSLLLTLLLTFSFLVLPVSAEEKGFAPVTSREITAEAIYLVNVDTGDVIYQKNAEQSRPPASLTKLMTAILAMENTPNLDTEILTYPLYVQDYLYLYQLEHGGVSSGNMRAGDQFSMRDYLYATLLPSANEAALTIADHVGGSQENFVDMMNKRAQELGATSTHFVNANGLPEDGHVSSAKDMALFAQHAMSLPGFKEIVTTTQHTASPLNRPDTVLTWNSTNFMQNKESNYFYNGLEGIKTGTLESAGRCFVSTATRDGFEYLLVLMGSKLDTESGVQDAFEDARAIYNWVFDSFHYKTLLEQGKVVGELPVRLSADQDHVQLIAAEHFSALMPDTVEATSVAQVVTTTADSLDAPVEKGAEIGTVTLIFDGQEIGSVPLLTGEAVAASSVLVFWEKTKAVTETLWFKFAVVFAALLLIAYILLMMIRNRNRKRRRRQGFDNRRY